MLAARRRALEVGDSIRIPSLRFPGSVFSARKWRRKTADHASRRVSRAVRASLTVLFVGCASPCSVAQTVAVLAPTAETRPIVRVTVDLAARAFDRILPFDVPFFITGPAPEGTLSLEVQYAVVPKSGDASTLLWMPSEPARWQPDRPSTPDQPFLVLVGTPLEAGRTYRVRFLFRNERSADATTTIADGRTEQKNYVSADAGLLYAGDIGIGALYVGGNIYFRPVNKGAPLGAVSSIGRRLALTVGLTISSIADEDNRTRSDLFWNQSLVLGAGYRIASSVRGGAGALVFRESDPNPLVTRRSAAVTWYVSFSFDLDVLKGFAG
jgi:hypothetical protein